jgi:membrane protease YdiL (CAAX protease family)
MRLGHRLPRRLHAGDGCGGRFCLAPELLEPVGLPVLAGNLSKAGRALSGSASQMKMENLMSTQAITATDNLHEPALSSEKDQYTPWQILGIWASVALPMGLIHWVVTPILIPRVDIEPGFLYLILITTGLVWEGIVAYMILRWEVKPFTWENIKDRVWLYTPTNPKTGARSKWLYLWTIPLIVIVQVGFRVLDPLNELWVKTFPFLTPPPHTVIQNLAKPAVGQWWLLGVLAVLIVFNYLVGEELIFRGILLPKMNGVFGMWDFIANAILFETYHLHKIEILPEMLIDWIDPWATKRFKSYWVAVILHGSEALILIVLFSMAIMGWL